MGNSIWALLDRVARRMSRKVELQALALQGLQERLYRIAPTMTSLKHFGILAIEHLEEVETEIPAIVEEFERESAQFRLGPPTPDSRAMFDDLKVILVSHIDQLRGLHIRQLKLMLASRSAVAPLLNLKAMTRSGAQVSSGDFAFLVTRRALLDWFNCQQMDALRLLGHNAARVTHQDPNHEVDGMLIALDDSSEHPSYMDVAETVFHPRSNAILGVP